MTLHLKNDFSEIKRIENAIEQFASSKNIPSKKLHALTVAVDELVSNTIKYGYDQGDTSEHLIEISFHYNHSNHEITVVISDDGKPHNPFDSPEAQTDLCLEEREPGGLGIHLVRSMMDSARHERQGGKNIVTVCKKINIT